MDDRREGAEPGENKTVEPKIPKHQKMKSKFSFFHDKIIELKKLNECLKILFGFLGASYRCFIEFSKFNYFSVNSLIIKIK
jgi:hypothetical protein